MQVIERSSVGLAILPRISETPGPKFFRDISYSHRFSWFSSVRPSKCWYKLS